MQPYQDKTRWKIYLAIFGVIIIVLSMLYTNYLVQKLQEEERKKVEVYKTAQEELQRADLNQDITFYDEIISGNTTIPVILVSEDEEILEWENWPDSSLVYVTEQLDRIKTKGPPPIEGYAAKLYYTESRILTLLRYLPWLQFILISAFITAGYLSFSSARRAEQNQVWVGMAKETAHQLGTPISAIIAWIETLRLTHEDDADTQEILTDLGDDVSRLELIADRFSKIGSEPNLVLEDVITQLNIQKEYMAKRSSRHVQYQFPDLSEGPVHAQMNAPLFNWVIENLLRNALDAMQQEGTITANVTEHNEYILITLSDTGKGIESKDLKTVFKPGYSTKKRGWGLGLSLAKRIIESYHGGKIYVSESVPGKGTTFNIELKK